MTIKGFFVVFAFVLLLLALACGIWIASFRYGLINKSNNTKFLNINPFMDVVKWPNILLKSCGVNTAKFLKYVWPFFNVIMKGLK